MTRVVAFKALPWVDLGLFNEKSNLVTCALNGTNVIKIIFEGFVAFDPKLIDKDILCFNEDR